MLAPRGPSMQSGCCRHFASREPWRLLILEPPHGQGPGQEDPSAPTRHSIPPPSGTRSPSPPGPVVLLDLFGCAGCFFTAQRLSLVAVTGGHSPVVACGLLIAERGLSSEPASVSAAQELSCSTASGICWDQGSNPCLLHWQADS